MKLSAISLLVVLPSTYAFAPNAFVARTRESNQQLNLFGFGKDKEEGNLIPDDEEEKSQGGFISRLFGDSHDSDKIKEDSDSFVSRWLKKKKVKAKDDLISGVELIFSGKKDGIFKHKPSKEMTGVEPEMTQLCSTISAQLYSCTSFDEFKLSTKDNQCDLYIYDNHASLFNATPPFCVATTGKTMILGWRGTSGLMDGLTDCAASPQSNIAWRKHAKTIKAQGPMTSVVLNDIANHEKAIIKKAKELSITEIITTG